MRPPVPQHDFADPDLRSHGCTIASLVYLRRMATDGEAGKDADADAAALRRASGTSLADFRRRGTTLQEAETAYEHAPWPEDRVPPAMRLFRGGSIRGDLLPLLAKDRTWALVAVNYGTVQDAGRGIGSFRGGHAIVAGEPDGGSVTVADPLRRQLVKWPVELLEHAAETFGTRPWGGGRGEFGVVSYAQTWREQATDLRATVADLRTAVARVTALRDGIRDQLTSAQARVKELEALGTPDCTDKVTAERERVKALISDGIDALIASVS